MILCQIEDNACNCDADFEKWYMAGGRMTVEDANTKSHIIFCSWCGKEYFISQTDIREEDNLKIHKCQHCGFNAVLCGV